MANKKVSQLVSKPSVLVTDLFPIADPTTGQLFKTTISDLGTAIGSGVSSVNTLVGAVVLDTDDIQELVSPTNKWFTDTRARAALSASSPLAYNSGTGVFSIPASTSSQNGYLTSTDWTTFNAKQPALSGTGFVKISGTTISYDNSTYLTTSSAASTYVPYTGATANVDLGTHTLLAAKGTFSSSGSSDTVGITHSSGSGIALNITKGGNGEGIYVNKSSGSGNAVTIVGTLNATTLVRNGGTSSQFLKADGSVDSTSYQPTLTNPVTGTGTSGILPKFTGTSTIGDSQIYDNGTRVSIGADVTTSSRFVSVSSTSGAYAIIAQASSGANGIFSTALGSGEIFRGQNSSGAYFIINNSANTFLSGNLNIGDFGSTSFKLNVIGTANITGALSGTSATFSGAVNSQSLVIKNSGVPAAQFFRDLDVTVVGSAGQGIEFGARSSSTFIAGAAIYGGLENPATTGNLVFQTLTAGSLSTKLTIASTGAATFSSSVITGSDIFTYVNGGIFFNGASSFTSGVFQNANGLNLQTGGSPKVTVTSAGNVGIGTTAPTTLLQITTSSTAADVLKITNGNQNLNLGVNDSGGGSYLFEYGNYAFRIGTSGTERMRIDSSGQTFAISEGTAFSAGVTAGAGTSTAIYVGRYGGTAGSFNSGTVSYVVWSNGNVVNTNNSYGAYSDIKIKENITDATSKLTDLLKVKIKNYNLIGDNKKQLGVIAQELEEVFPNMVEEIKDYNSNETIKSVKYSVFVPMLIKAVQELSDKITTLENK
jgi:hypothetical protein